MKFAGPAASLPKHPQLSQEDQEREIFLAASQHGVQATFLAAIRIAEAGRPGREFGVLSTEAETYAEQATICARSIRNNLFRFVIANATPPTGPNDTYSPRFVAFMGARWAPADVANDPNKLNQHWVSNVMAAYQASGISQLRALDGRITEEIA